MSESVESLRRVRLEVEEIAVSSISPDPENPNEFPEGTLEALRADIEARGFVQPIVVRPDGDDHYTIVDGEHRWRAVRDLGRETIPCVVDELQETEGRLRLLAMNRLRGQANPTLLAAAVVDLAERVGEDELRERLAMDDEEYAIATAGADVDESVASIEPTVTLSWTLEVADADTIDDALDATGLEDRGAALLHLLETVGK